MILLHTCVISEIARPEPDPAVLAWFSATPDELLRLSVLSLGEIKKGADLLDPGPRRARIEKWLDELAATFSDRILPIDQDVALIWGRLSARCRREGRARPPVDSLLAATALRFELSLATRDVSDFEGTGVKLVNPWSSVKG